MILDVGRTFLHRDDNLGFVNRLDGWNSGMESCSSSICGEIVRCQLWCYEAKGHWRNWSIVIRS